MPLPNGRACLRMMAARWSSHAYASFVSVASTYAYAFARSNAHAMGGYQSMTR